MTVVVNVVSGPDEEVGLHLQHGCKRRKAEMLILTSVGPDSRSLPIPDLSVVERHVVHSGDDDEADNDDEATEVEDGAVADAEAALQDDDAAEEVAEAPAEEAEEQA